MAKEPEVTVELAREFGLKEDEYRRVLDILGRTPNYTELGIFSVMWSEHCSYKSSRIHLKQFPTEGPTVIQGPGENAGIVDIGDGQGVAFKMESHNHPSFIEPHQGAATGVGGILRDVFTMGARPFASLNSLSFGEPDHPRTPYLLSGVVSGVGGYGNCIGVATVGGEVRFHPCYNGNILVNAFNAGLVDLDKIFRSKAAGVGNPVLYVGSRTGRDGIHGATMASEEFGEGGEERRPTVQVGDPFTEKLLLEACMELFSKDVVVSIQDMGAAGLTSSSVEMAAKGGVGIELNLEKVPTREPGMTPYELMLSESQERMLLVAKAGREHEVIDIFRKWDLDVAVVGRITDTGRMHLKWEDELVADLPLKPLAEGVVYDRPRERPSWQDEVQKLDESGVPVPGGLTSVLASLLSSANLSSRRWVWEQYDYLVGSRTVVAPGSDAAVLRILGTNKAVALACDVNPRHCYLDPHEGGMRAIAECARNLACSGAKPLGTTNCLNFGNPERPAIAWQFAEATRGLADACRALEAPIVSGNVSLYNETSGKAIHPTPTVAMVGLIEKLEHHTTQFFEKAGDTIVLLGENLPGLGGSEYLWQVHGLEKGVPPRLDLEREKAVQQTCLEAIRAGIVRSAHDVSDGGLAVALAECSFSYRRVLNGRPLLGADVEIPWSERPDALLFGEAAGRILLTVRDAKDVERVRELASARKCPVQVIGKVTEGTGGTHGRLRINDLVDADLGAIFDAWDTALDTIARGRRTGK